MSGNTLERAPTLSPAEAVDSSALPPRGAPGMAPRGDPPPHPRTLRGARRLSVGRLPLDHGAGVGLSALRDQGAGRRAIPPAPPRQLFLVCSHSGEVLGEQVVGRPYTRAGEGGVSWAETSPMASAPGGPLGRGPRAAGEEAVSPASRSCATLPPPAAGLPRASPLPTSTAMTPLRGGDLSPAAAAGRQGKPQAVGLPKHFTRRFSEPIELQIESLSALVAYTLLTLWYLMCAACLIVEVIPQAQWSIVSVCGREFATNLRYLDRWVSDCVTQTPSTNPLTPSAVNMTWEGGDLGYLNDNLKRYRRVVISLPRSDTQSTDIQRYTLQARVTTTPLPADAAAAVPGASPALSFTAVLTCRAKTRRCDTVRLPAEMLMQRRGDSRHASVAVSLLDVPPDLAAAAATHGSTVGVAYQKRAYTLATVIWRYIFLFISFLHTLRFIACRRFTSSLYEQSWIVVLQIALLWYLNPLYAANIVSRPLPTVLAFLEFRIPTYFVAVTMAFMFSVMTASMSWTQRGGSASSRKRGAAAGRVDKNRGTPVAAGEPLSEGGLGDGDDAVGSREVREEAEGWQRRRSRKTWVRRLLDAVLTSRNVYDPPVWTKAIAVMYLLAIVALDISEALVDTSYWAPGSNSDSSFKGIGGAVIALLLLGGVVCLGLLIYVRNYLGNKPYLESRAQQLACRVFIMVFFTTIFYYIIHCLVFFLYYNRNVSATASRTPFVQLPALMIACGFTNLMTIVYTTRNHNVGIPIRPTDQRWKFLVWPDSWYRWLARRGGSQYVFYTEEEETSFYRIQFEFRRRQYLAKLKRQRGRNQQQQQQQGRRPSRDRHGSRAPSPPGGTDTTDTDSLMWMSELGSTALDLMGGMGAGGEDSYPPSRAGSRRNSTLSPAVVHVDPPAAHKTSAPATGAGEASPPVPSSVPLGSSPSVDVGRGGGSSARPFHLPPASAPTVTGHRRAGSADANDSEERDGERAGGLQRTGARTLHVDDLRAILRGGRGQASGARSVTPGREMGDTAAQALRRSHTVDLAAMVRPRVEAHPGSAVTFQRLYGRGVLNMDHFSTYFLPDGAAGVRGEGLGARGGSVRLSGRSSSAAGEGGPVYHVAGPARRRTVSTLVPHPHPVSPSAAEGDGQGGGAAAAAARAASLLLPRLRTSEGTALRSRSWGTSLGRWVPPSPTATTTPAAPRGEGAAEEGEGPALRAYELFLPHSDKDAAGAGGGDGEDAGGRSRAAGVTGGGRPRLGLARAVARARERLGDLVARAEHTLLERPMRALDRLETDFFDVVYRPFPTLSYLPFFNMETAVDCYNLSWEAYGVEESAGDAPIVTGMAVAPTTVPKAALHGVKKVLCGCCPATESDSDTAGESPEAARHTAPHGSDEVARTGLGGERSQTVSAGGEERVGEGRAVAGDGYGGADDVTVPVEPTAAARRATVEDTAARPPAAQQDASGLLPINVGKYGYKLLYVAEVKQVQVLLAMLDTTAQEHKGKAPRLVLSFRGTANMSNAKYDMNIHRVVWKEMEEPLPTRRGADGLAASADAGSDGIVSNVASTAHKAYLGCASCWRSILSKTSWRPTCHAGFLSIWRAMRPLLMPKLLEVLRADTDTVYRIFTTGHSLGGALASLCAYSIHRELLKMDYPIPDVTVYTYGQPRLGNRTFRNMYNKAVPRSFRIMNESDIVVTMTMFGGYHVGIEVNVDRYGNFIVKPTDMEKMLAPTKGRGMAIMNHLMTSYGESINAMVAQTPCPARGLACYLTADSEKIMREEGSAVRPAPTQGS